MAKIFVRRENLVIPRLMEISNHRSGASLVAIKHRGFGSEGAFSEGFIFH